MTIRIYGNELPPHAPVDLQIDVQGLEKLYGLADVNRHGQVAPRLVSGPVIEKETSADKGEGGAVAKEDGSTTCPPCVKKSSS